MSDFNASQSDDPVADKEVVHIGDETDFIEAFESIKNFPEDHEEAAQGTVVSSVNVADDEIRKQLTEELDQLVDRIKQTSPEYTPPAFSPRRLINLLGENFPRISSDFSSRMVGQLRSGVAKDLFDTDTWKGVWYVVNYSLEYQRDLLRRRIAGEFEVDEWGYDQEVVDAVKPFFQFLYSKYWRVQVTGIENIPDEGRSLLASNHSGQLPFDGSMVGLAVLNEHPSKRTVRTLYASWFPTMPFVSTLFVKLGQTLASEENGIRLLEQDQLVAVYPEGYNGVGKLFKDRYRLAGFGRGDFVRMAIITGSPIIPVSVVGAEETYISLAKSDFMARLLGFPYFPISPTFPWFGLLGLVPIPSKWYIDFGEPIPTSHYGVKAANNTMLVSQLTDQTRNIVQKMIYARLASRKSILFG